MEPNEVLRSLLEWRGIIEPCEACHGSGGRVYASTSTWRGGIGGSSLTHGVCDVCWGSVDASAPWTNLRAMELTTHERIEIRASSLFSESIGVRFDACRVAAGEVADELEKIARKRSASDEKKRVAAALPAMLRKVCHRTEERGGR